MYMYSQRNPVSHPIYIKKNNYSVPVFVTLSLTKKLYVFFLSVIGHILGGLSL